MKRKIIYGSILLTLICGQAIMQGCRKEPLPQPPSVPLSEELTPDKFPKMIVPEDNELTKEKTSLGRRLFYDPILSGDSTQSCASCHRQENAFSDPRKFSVGIDGVEGTRNASSLVNSAWGAPFFWDGRSESLETQAMEPVENEIEMHLDWAEAVKRLNRSPHYPLLFQRAFGTKKITADHVVKAIASFERTIVSAGSKYDQWRRGELELSYEEYEGYKLFFNETGDCFHCHATELFTDNAFHNNGLDSIFSDRGLEDITGNAEDRGKFKTPTVRNVELTAPYMHDGRFETLREVLDFYSDGTRHSPTLDPLILKSKPPGRPRLKEIEKDHLIAFLKTLTDLDITTKEELSDPWK